MQGLVVVVVALLLRQPAKEDIQRVEIKVSQSMRHYSPMETLRQPIFWLLYLMFTMVCTGGIMAVAQLAPIAKDFQVADVPVTFMGLTLAALPFALAIDRVLNGVTRPFFGWVSDHIGRENTMFIAFGLEGLAVLALAQFGQDPLMFVVLSGLVFFGWGEIYSLFPAICGDTFGTKYAAANYGMLYTAKGTASLLVPLANVLQQATGSWRGVFYTACVLDLLAAIIAVVVLKRMRASRMLAEQAGLAGAHAD
jgi:OFA family oxalate/formate antiporter-like MFS transporter